MRRARQRDQFWERAASWRQSSCEWELTLSSESRRVPLDCCSDVTFHVFSSSQLQLQCASPITTQPVQQPHCNTDDNDTQFIHTISKARILARNRRASFQSALGAERTIGYDDGERMASRRTKPSVLSLLLFHFILVCLDHCCRHCADGRVERS